MNEKKLTSLLSDERGLTTVEYIIVLALIAILAIGIWRAFGQNVTNAVDNANTNFQQNAGNVQPQAPTN
ncbi:MAG: hypothetical protein R3A47_00035 [Polyangiales bacterium]